MASKLLRGNRSHQCETLGRVATICVGLLMLVQLFPSVAVAASGTGRQSATDILPASGALFGGYPGHWNGETHRQTRIQNFEALIGRKIALERIFYAWDDVFPATDDYWSRDQGHTLILSWGAGERDGSIVPWADIADGL